MTEKYELIEIIGQGMYGKVYKSLNKYENKYYAIKTLNFQNISQKERLNIETEINLLQELKHPNIVLYKESFIDKNQNLNIVTTFCEGGDLYQKIFKSQKNYFQEKEIINALIQLLLGLSYIHDKKIVHRDIKTKNIFIQNEHTLRIGDFGIAKIFNSNNNNNKNTNLNKMVGTPLYMAPECFKQNKKYSYKSDIWSLGCCIYEMCNLKHAFEGQFFPAVSIKISEGKRLPLNKIYSKELRNVIDSMLNLNPRNRPTIASLIEKTFLKKYVAEYINDFISNYRRYEGNEEQIDILKEQAEKFQIFDVKLNLDNLNLNGYYIIDNNNNLINNADINNNEINENNLINEENKKVEIKSKQNKNNFYKRIDFNDNKYLSLVNDKYKENKKYKKVLNISPEQKYKNSEINNYISNNNKILAKQQSTINYNYTNESFDNFNNIKKIMKNKKIIKNHEHERERINTKNKSDNLYNINELNQLNINKNENIYINEKQSIINKRIKYFKERCIKALGNNFYNKAYIYLKKMRKNNSINNDIKREYLSDTFGKNNIGYWQLIEQILILEDILQNS